MRKGIGLALSLFIGGMALAGPGLAQGQAVKSSWADVPVGIDGLNKDWTGLPLLTDKKSKAEYAFQNDGENLYILLVFKERKSLSTLETSGMKIYYTLDGKKKKNDGLHFAKRQLTAAELVASLESKGEVLTEEHKAKIFSQPGYIMYDGELIKPPKQAPSGPLPDHVQLPTFRSQSQQRVFTYEFRIPLERFARIGGLGAEPGQNVTLGFEWGGMTKEMIAKQMTDSAESSTRASSRATSIESAFSEGDDSVDLGGGGGGGFRRNPMAAKYTIWVNIKLAGEGD